MTRWILLTTLGVVVLAACGDEGSDDVIGGSDGSGSLDGSTWISTSITEGGAARGLVEGSELRIGFKDGRISVRAGCNSIGGTYAVDAGRLAVGAMMMTEMGCPGPLMEQDSWLAGTVFASPLDVVVDGDRLTLTRDDLTLEFGSRESLSPDLPLTGTDWALSGIRDGEAVSSVPAGVLRTPSLRIDDDGTVTVDTGCNRGRGTAQITGGTLSFAPLLTTKMACADESGRQTEAAVVAVLDGDVDWTVTEHQLRLDKGDHGLTWRGTP